MSNLVIVAIPDENDRVWRVSSEPIPHLTLLFLGEADQVDNVESIVQFVEHAASTTLQRFYLPVDRRGELGEDGADVLFFKKGRWGYKDIRDFRVQLLKDNNIRTAYDTARQHDGPWLPHLTLGYKDKPAKTDTNDPDYGFYDVSFNKIAVWIEDYSGPEFPLEDEFDKWETMETAPIDVAMSKTSEVGEAYILEHYGVKGMKWGVRKEETKGATGTLKKAFDPEGHDLATDLAKNFVFSAVAFPLAIPSSVRLWRGAYRGTKAKAQDVLEKRDDKKFEKVAKSQEGFVAIHNGAADKFNADIAKVNSRYTEADLAKPAKRRAYDKEVQTTMQEAYRDSANRIGNKRGTKHLDVEFQPNGEDFAIKIRDGQQKPTVEKATAEETKAKHDALATGSDSLIHAYLDDDGTVTFAGKIHRAPSGHILGLEFDDFKPNPMIHSAELGAEYMVFNGLMDPDEFLEHHGVKGMRWGVRKEETKSGGHIRISNKNNAAGLSVPVAGAFAAAIVFATPLTPALFLSPRVRSEFKAANAQNKKAQADKKYKKAIASSKKAVEVHNMAADEINSKLPAFNSDKRWKGMTPDSPKQKAYDNAAETELLNPAYAKAAVKVYGSESPTGRYKFEIDNASQGTLKFRDTLKEAHDEKFAKHAADDEVMEAEIGFVIKRNSSGHILGFDLDDAAKEIAHSAIEDSIQAGAEFMEHHGVKGMHWGVRKEDVSNAAKSGTTSIAKGIREVEKVVGDINFESRTAKMKNKETGEDEQHSKADRMVLEATHPEYRKDMAAINAKPEYVKAKKLRNRLLKPFDATTKAYRKEAREAYIHRLETEANKMKNASGTREYTIRERGGDLPTSKYQWEVSTREARHVDGPGYILVDVLTDADGFITGTKTAEDSMAQSVADGAHFLAAMGIIGEDELEHYGVKGMQWGVRRSREAPLAVTPTGRSRVPHGNRRKTKIKVEGGQNHEATSDAIKVAEHREKLKKSGVHALSNSELKELNQRLQLEVQAAQLTSSRGQKFIQRQLEQQGQQTVQRGIRNVGPAAGLAADTKLGRKVVKKGAKTAAKVAITAALL